MPGKRRLNDLPLNSNINVPSNAAFHPEVTWKSPPRWFWYPGSGAQVFGQTRFRMWLWGFSADVITIYSQLTFSKADYPPQRGWDSSDQLKAFRARTEGSWEKQEFYLRSVTQVLPEFPTCQPDLWNLDFPAIITINGPIPLKSISLILTFCLFSLLRPSTSPPKPFKLCLSLSSSEFGQNTWSPVSSEDIISQSAGWCFLPPPPRHTYPLSV